MLWGSSVGWLSFGQRLLPVSSIAQQRSSTSSTLGMLSASPVEAGLHTSVGPEEPGGPTTALGRCPRGL